MIELIHALAWFLYQLVIVTVGIIAGVVVLTLVAKGFITFLLWMGWR